MDATKIDAIAVANFFYKILQEIAEKCKNSYFSTSIQELDKLVKNVRELTKYPYVYWSHRYGPRRITFYNIAVEHTKYDVFEANQETFNEGNWFLDISCIPRDNEIVNLLLKGIKQENLDGQLLFPFMENNNLFEGILRITKKE